jgi:hypothetical protein
MKHGVKGDAWFGRTKTSKHVGIRGYECILQVKQYHSLFPKESALKDAPGGVHIILEGSTKGEVPLVGLPL